ncbi:DUF4132 domain-containing protein [Actinomadura alba]|uniref:DUF4132 domain-containing protein n=1 Tax=Actinomadura alba TaxID=406431 RepID=A0ABR7LTP9_9ACTN|nr:DUF4132 domain-containing protein [Actinomadura alba]MBC6468212.1 DUF4132 domain-containing protein [Actinomadura alba]
MLYDRLMERARVDDGLDDVRMKAADTLPWLVDLLDRLRQNFTARLRSRGVREHEELAAAGHEAHVELTQRLLDCRDQAERRAAALTLMLAAEFTDTLWDHYDELRLVMPGTRGWTPTEVAVMLARVTEYELSFWFAESLSLVLNAAEDLTPDDIRAVVPSLNHVSQALMRDSGIGASERRALLGRLRKLLTTADDARLPEGVLPPYDSWAAPLRERLESAPPAALTELVLHAADLARPRPSQKWRRRCLELVESASAHDLVEQCLRGLATGAPFCSAKHEYPAWVADLHLHYLAHPNHADLARGLVWAAALAGGSSAVGSLTRLTERAVDIKSDVIEDLVLAGAAINALGDIDDPSALEALWRLQAKIKHRGLRKQLDTALRAAAARQGITPGQLIERSVPAHGLGADGSLVRKLGDHEAAVVIVDPMTVRLIYATADGRALRSAPTALKESHADEIKELKALLKEVRGTLSGERARIEGLMSAERVWPYGEWNRHYREHPVTGVVARGLIWEFEGPDGEWTAATPADGGLVTAGGRPLPTPGEGTRVRVWHPIRASAQEIRTWREFVTVNQMRQPFKQAFREIYLLTPAELETGGYSNRFAAHIVYYRRLYALFKERGWQANFLGSYDGGYSGEAIGVLAEGAWRACFYHENADEGADYPDYAATDQVRFQRRDGRQWRETPLDTVPPIVFSEAMRDVDLFVGVTSIAADADWVDRGEERYGAYWRETTFGDLTASAEVRRDALERIIPRTKIAKRCSFAGRYLVVRGDMRTYKIHLGSANILMEPDDSYLCIVPSRRKGGDKVFLPFEDERLALILSKAFLLADDTKITDETILRQIKELR